MRVMGKWMILMICIFIFSCQVDHRNNGVKGSESAFDARKWKEKKGADYPYRASMVDEILYGDRVRSLRYPEIIDLLGEPDRTSEKHLYYTISQKRIGAWPMSTQTLVIKISDNDNVEWIKLHG
ncbi:hypothetical protein [Portibacter marinus]|uniref:hypothetical protein n=1 Tax=Portibacter marinus TaxID=2898660 RepID=UPI001F1FB86A|nr:hypothetical protein [Portibacter marinus]